jgi:hypothetical protein
MKPTEDDDEDFPYSSPDLSPGMPEPATSSAETDQLSVEDYKTVLRLLVGSARVGNDEFRQRLKTWRKTIQNTNLEGSVPILELGETSRASSRSFSVVFRFLEPIKNNRLMRLIRRRYHIYVGSGNPS